MTADNRDLASREDTPIVLRQSPPHVNREIILASVPASASPYPPGGGRLAGAEV